MSNEWYTPSKYIEAAREVMGSIDLDPASCALANQTVRAARYYTQEDDGLSKAWYGNVWLNPPFEGTRARESWTKRIMREYEQGNIQQAILLMPAMTEAKWFQALWNVPICFALTRIPFHNGIVHIGNSPFASCFFYFGANEQRFIDVFSQFGRIAKAVDVPVAKPRQLELIA